MGLYAAHHTRFIIRGDSPENIKTLFQAVVGMDRRKWDIARTNKLHTPESSFIWSQAGSIFPDLGESQDTFLKMLLDIDSDYPAFNRSMWKLVGTGGDCLFDVFAASKYGTPDAIMPMFQQLKKYMVLSPMQIVHRTLEFDSLTEEVIYYDTEKDRFMIGDGHYYYADDENHPARIKPQDNLRCKNIDIEYPGFWVPEMVYQPKTPE